MREGIGNFCDMFWDLILNLFNLVIIPRSVIYFGIQHWCVSTFDIQQRGDYTLGGKQNFLKTFLTAFQF